MRSYFQYLSCAIVAATRMCMARIAEMTIYRINICRIVNNFSFDISANIYSADMCYISAKLPFQKNVVLEQVLPKHFVRQLVVRQLVVRQNVVWQNVVWQNVVWQHFVRQHFVQQLVVQQNVIQQNVVRQLVVRNNDAAFCIAALSAGVDFMKPFRPKFTDETLFGIIYM
jgi:hypothetical protein